MWRQKGDKSMASPNAQVIELKHARNHEEPKYIAGEDWNFAWLDCEKATVIQMWRRGKTLVDMADAVQRLPIEVLILLADLLERGAIQPRKGFRWYKKESGVKESEIRNRN